MKERYFFNSDSVDELAIDTILYGPYEFDAQSFV